MKKLIILLTLVFMADTIYAQQMYFDLAVNCSASNACAAFTDSTCQTVAAPSEARCVCSAGSVPNETTAAAGECFSLTSYFDTPCSTADNCTTAGHTGAECLSIVLVSPPLSRCGCPTGTVPSSPGATAADFPTGTCETPTETPPVVATTEAPNDPANTTIESSNDSANTTTESSNVPTGLQKFFNVSCTNRTDCNLHKAECGVVSGTKNTKCYCPEKWEPTTPGTETTYATGMCRFQAELNDPCNPSYADCVVENSACVDDGSNQGDWRCLCDDGFRLYEAEDGSVVCGRILTHQEYPVCMDCERNGGLCYSTNGTLLLTNPGAAYGCDCPVTKITGDNGTDCGKALVNVICNIQNFTMQVCYEPHPNINFTTGAVMYADGYGTVEACKGVPVPNGSVCPGQTQRQLILQLSSDKKHQCGVQEYKHVQKITFEKTIVVANDADGVNSDYHFDVFCSMQTQSSSGFNAFGVRGVPGNDQGEHLEPDIDFAVYNELGTELSEGVALRLGDKIRLRIELTADGTYAAAHVLRCTASTSPKIPDEDADTAVLLVDSCPAPVQSVFTNDNVWRMEANQPNVLETGLLPSFKLPRGFDVFIHCTLKLCLSGSEDDCRPVDCGGTNSMGRRKRQADDSSNVEITRKITYLEEENSSKVVMDETGFAIMIAVLMIIMVILVVLVVILYLKLRGRGSYVEDFGAPPRKPQQFALPRIGNPAMRM